MGVSNLTTEQIKSKINAEASHLKLIKSRTKITKENWREFELAVRIDPLKLYEVPPICIEICKDEKPFRWGTFGNISTIFGKAKSRKSFLVTLLIIAAIKGYFHLIRILLQEGKTKLLFFDTEQSPYDISIMLKRIEKVTGIPIPCYIEVFGLRTLTPGERKIFIIQKIESETELGIVFIDGVRDLATDPILDAEQANDIVTDLMRLSEEKHIHIVNVLHQNRGNDHAVGHIGRELINKSESVVLVETKDGITDVKHEFSRGQAFESFGFKVDENGLPFILDDYQSDQGPTIKKKLIPSQVPDETHKKIMNEVFKIQKEYSRADLITNIILKYHEFGIGFGESKAREFLEHCKNQSIIKHNGKNSKAAKYIFKA